MLYLAWRSSRGSTRLAITRCAALVSGGSFAACEWMLVPLHQPGTVAAFAVLGITPPFTAVAIEMDLVLAVVRGKAPSQSEDCLRRLDLPSSPLQQTIGLPRLLGGRAWHHVRVKDLP
mmetsp:Transcript_69344/g.160659  ORF Transcript_69344/g.160659 Transcript_69344/m.160659 type:complete len:118 (+) Transcript_69344:244-597(+)